MGTVLVIDDDEMLRTALVDALKASGITTHSASDGKEGLETAKKIHPNVVVLDEHMPHMSGQEFIELLRKEPWGDQVKVIVFTVNVDIDTINKKLMAGVTDYIDKASSRPEQVVAAIQKYFAESQAPAN